MQAMRIVAVGWALAGLLGAEPARAGTETFDATGFGGGSAWTSSGSFTGRQDIVWTYANARGIPSVYEGNPSMALRGSPKGWVRSAVLAGGVGRVSAAFKQGAAAAVDCDVRVNDQLIGNYKSSGVSGSVEIVSFEAFVASNRLPFTNDFVLTVSNRVTASGVVAIDDLTWEPFRLFAWLPQTNAYPAYVGKEFEVTATVFDIGQPWTGAWSVEPPFAGGIWYADTASLLLIPASADVGKTFTLTFAASDPEGTGHVHRASCPMTVLEGPRWVDFEGASFGYNTSDGVVTNLNGMNWRFRNVATSDSTDRKIGATSARFRHTTALAASMESQSAFPGIGTVSMNYACYWSNRVVLFAVQVHGDGEEEWTTVPNGTFNVEGHDDITNSVFSVDVGRSDDVWIRLITTGNANQIANIDNLRVRPPDELLPRLVCAGGSNAPVGWETVLEFTLANAEGILRSWDYALSPPNANAAFESDDHGPLRLRFSPEGTNDWGTYAVAVTSRIGGAVVGATAVTVRVVSPPTFELVPLATNIAVPGIVDIKTTNVSLHGGGTDWDNQWVLSPSFEKTPSKNQRNWYRIVAGTTAADVGPHTVSAVLTDRGTGVTATNALVLVVTDGGGGLTNELYEIVSCSATNLAVNGRTGRVFRVFGTTNLLRSDWSWQGPPVTNTDGGDVWLDLPTPSGATPFFYGVRVREAP